jgi:hypothetical protein
LLRAQKSLRSTNPRNIPRAGSTGESSQTDHAVAKVSTHKTWTILLVIDLTDRVDPSAISMN